MQVWERSLVLGKSQVLDLTVVFPYNHDKHDSVWPILVGMFTWVICLWLFKSTRKLRTFMQTYHAHIAVTLKITRVSGKYMRFWIVILEIEHAGVWHKPSLLLWYCIVGLPLRILHFMKISHFLLWLAHLAPSSSLVIYTSVSLDWPWSLVFALHNAKV